MPGAIAPYDEMPWFWSDQRDQTLQVAGLPDEGDGSVVRDLPDASIRVRPKAGRLVAASGFGPNGRIAREIRLADAAVGLKSLLARQAVAA